MGRSNGLLRSAACAAALGAALGCNSEAKFIQPGKFSENDPRPLVMQSNSNRRFVFVVKASPGKPSAEGEPAHAYYIYSEPPPDTAQEVTSKLIASLKVPEGPEGSVDAEVATKIIDLSKRTQTIVLLRDTLFRLAEARANGFISETAFAEEFRLVVESGFKIASAQPEATVAASDGLTKLTDSLANISPKGTFLSPTTKPTANQELYKQTLESVDKLTDTLKAMGGDGTYPR